MQVWNVQGEGYWSKSQANANAVRNHALELRPTKEKIFCIVV